MKGIEKQLWEQYWSNRSLANRNAVVEHYVPWVRKHATSTKLRLATGCRLDEDDLCSVGCIALIDVVDRFDGQRQVKFKSFALLRILGAMVDEIRNLDWVPRLERARQKKGLVEPVEMLTPHGQTDEHNEFWLAVAPEEPLEMDNKEEVEAAMRKFKPRDQQIIRMRFVDGMTMSEIGQAVGLSESRISQKFTQFVKQGLLAG